MDEKQRKAYYKLIGISESDREEGFKKAANKGVNKEEVFTLEQKKLEQVEAIKADVWERLLPAIENLQGSPKQKQWAHDLKQKVAERLATLVALNKISEQQAFSKLNLADARFWINNRNNLDSI